MNGKTIFRNNSNNQIIINSKGNMLRQIIRNFLKIKALEELYESSLKLIGLLFSSILAVISIKNKFTVLG
jgi:hypothetical protein